MSTPIVRQLRFVEIASAVVLAAGAVAADFPGRRLLVALATGTLLAALGLPAIAELRARRMRRQLALQPRASAPAASPYAAGFSRLAAGDAAAAHALLVAACDADPDDVDAQFHRAAACAELGRWPDAVVALQRVVAHRPNDAEAHLRLALALKALGRRFEAARAAQESLRLNPYLAGAQQALAEMRDTARMVRGGRKAS